MENNHNLKQAFGCFADWRERFLEETPSGSSVYLRQSSAHFTCCHLEEIGLDITDMMPAELIEDAERYRAWSSGREA